MFPNSPKNLRHQLGRCESIPRVSPMSVDHRYASPVHGGQVRSGQSV